MPVFAIEVPDMNDSMSSITIDEVEYYVRFTYNEKYDYWSFGVYDVDEEPIVAMTRIVPNFPLFHYLDSLELPPGVFTCISDTEEVGRDAFLNGTAEFLYLEPEDLEDAIAEEEGTDEDEDEDEDE